MAKKKTKKKGTHRPSQAAPETARRTSVVLDVYTQDAVDRWDAMSAVEQYYHDRVYYDLEAQRATYHGALCGALRKIPPTRIDLSPPWVRITDWTWNLTPLSSVGSTRGIGQRFNIGVDLDRARGQAFPSLYLAQDEATARLEKFGLTKKGIRDDIRHIRVRVA